MNTYIVKSQVELDAIPSTFNGTIVIDYGSPKNPADIYTRYRYPVKVIGNNYAVLYGNSEAEAHDTSTVTAFDSAYIEAYDNSVVTACEKSQVKAFGYAKLSRYGNATVIDNTVPANQE